MAHRKRDNTALAVKTRVRSAIAAGLPPTARILETCIGEGRMWRRVWSRFAGVGLDIDPDAASAAAAERPGWGCYRADAIKALECGVFGRIAFDVVDIDTYGSPWAFIRAWMLSDRARAPETAVVLTDGYMSRSRMVRCAALFGPGLAMGGDDASYMEVARERVSGWCAASSLALVSWTVSKGPGGKMAQHSMVVRAG